MRLVMKIDLKNLEPQIGSSRLSLYNYRYSPMDNSILHMAKVVDTLTVESLDTRGYKTDISLIGLGTFPNNLNIMDCNIERNFTVFDYTNTFDFVDEDSPLMISKLYISGEVHGGEINIPTLFGADVGKLKIGHLDLADLKFKQTVNISAMREDDIEMHFFATDIGKITLPANKESHTLGEILRHEYNPEIAIEYR